MRNYELRLPEGDLASRRNASPQRELIKNQISENHVLIDCSRVLSISESYADEIFGVLVKKYGIDFVLKNTTVVNASKSVLRVIASVIYRRDSECGLSKDESVA